MSVAATLPLRFGRACVGPLWSCLETGAAIVTDPCGAGRPKLESLWVRDRGVRWHVRSCGRGPSVLLLHGTGASSHSFERLIAQLARRYTVYAPDLPGHAKSVCEPQFDPTLANLARGLGRLVDALELRPRIVIGHSAGAALAAQMCLDRVVEPQLIVGLAAALVPFRGLARAVFPRAAALLSRSVGPALLASWVSQRNRTARVLQQTGSHLDAEGIEAYRRLAGHPEHVAGVLTMMARWNLDPVFESLPKIKAPVLLLAGQHDRAVPVEQVRVVSKRLPNSQLVVVPDAGHLLHEEAPGRICEHITEHFDRHCDPQRPRR